MSEPETMAVEELRTLLGRRKGKARVLIHLHDGKGRVVEGILPATQDDGEYGVGDDMLNVVYLYGLLTDDYEDEAH